MIKHKKKTILFIDDDEDDFLLLNDLFKECHEDIVLQWVKDGEEALDYLTRQTADGQDTSSLFLILLDLNMPKLSGHEVLRQIRSNHELQHIPVVVLTNSMNKEDAQNAYRLGVNSFIRKPSGFKELQEFVRTLCKYWFEYSILV